MKRMFLLVMALVLVLVTFLAGCSSKQTANPSAGKEVIIEKDSTAKNNDAKNSGNTANADKLKEFTLEELAQYNGTNGKPAYVAVKGIVYDVTEAKLWRDGTHSPMGAQNVAGKDLTAELGEAPPSHQNQEYWEKLPKVGVLKSTPKQ